MVSIKNFIVGSLFAAVAVAQAPTMNFSSSDTQSLAATPDSQKQAWCDGQRDICGNLCNGVGKNNCDQKTLTYSCTCGNGSAPGLAYYSTSMVGFQCNALKGKCHSAATTQDANDACDRNYVCGNGTADDAKKAGAAAASAATATTMTTEMPTTAAPTNAPAATSNAAANLEVYGPGVVAVAILGAFGAVL